MLILARLVRSESFWAVVKVRSPHNGPEVSYPRLEDMCASPHTTSQAIEHMPQPAPEASFTHGGHFDFPPLRSPLHVHVHPCPKSQLGSTALTIVGHGTSATTQPPSGPATHLSPPTLLGQCNGNVAFASKMFHHGMQH